MKNKKEMFCPELAQLRLVFFSYSLNVFVSLNMHFVCIYINFSNQKCEASVQFAFFVDNLLQVAHEAIWQQAVGSQSIYPLLYYRWSVILSH